MLQIPRIARLTSCSCGNQLEYNSDFLADGSVQVQVDVQLKDGTRHYSSRVVERLDSGAQSCDPEQLLCREGEMTLIDRHWVATRQGSRVQMTIKEHTSSSRQRATQSPF